MLINSDMINELENELNTLEPGAVSDVRSQLDSDDGYFSNDPQTYLDWCDSFEGDAFIQALELRLMLLGGTLPTSVPSLFPVQIITGVRSRPSSLALGFRSAA